MEKYLDRSVGSLLVPEVLDKLEIIIVNDGSKDRTLEIANGYKATYPQSVIVIDKPNGHYGSTVNAALKIATGKYFRILDADDWFNSEALGKFVAKLAALDVDCVYTHFTKQIEGKPISQKVDGLVYNKALAIDAELIQKACIVMHTLTFRLDLLRRINYHQTEGICYTDTEYVYYPLTAANTIYFLDVDLYQYYVGRDDQSMSITSMIKCRSHFVKILNRILDTPETATTIHDNYLLMKNAESVHLMKMILYAYLILNKPSSAEQKALKVLMSRIDNFSHDAFEQICSQTLYKFPIYKYWYNSNVIAKPLLAIIRLLLK
jgi:glycosyltransferase involved in cell wall biosynthesis